MNLTLQLRHQHARILMMLGDLEADLADPGSPFRADSLHWQWCHLDQWLEVHLAFEQTELYPELLRASQAASKAPLGIQVSGQPATGLFNPEHELLELRRLLGEHRRRFGRPQAIAGDLEGFRRDLATIAGRVRARIRREQALVYPAVASIDASRLPASAARLPQ